MSWLKLSRKFFEHEIWLEPREFSKAEAWLDLIKSANWSDGSLMIGNKIIKLKRGQLAASQRYLKKRWGWKSLKKVQSYLELLKKEVMIEVEKESVTTIITICKYDTYNSIETPDKSDRSHLKSQIGVSKESDRSQIGVKEEEEIENKEEIKKKKKTSPIEKEPYASWLAQIADDDLFREQVARQHRLFDAEFDNMLENFLHHKAAVGELNHRSYSDFRKNFLFWIPKNLEQKSKSNASNASNGKTRNHSNLIDEATARRVFEKVTAKDR